VFCAQSKLWTPLLKFDNYSPGSWPRAASVYVLDFMLEADTSSIQSEDDVINYTYDDFWDNNCQLCLWLFNVGLQVSIALMAQSIYHFSKVVLAVILVEMDILCIFC